jgi:hypothetical protein
VELIGDSLDGREGIAGIVCARLLKSVTAAANAISFISSAPKPAW